MSTSVPASDQERELAARFCAGNLDAFRELHALHDQALLAFLVNRAGNRDDAMEIAQDVWLRAWKARARFNGRHFRGWIFEIARNRLVDVQRRRRETTGSDGLDRQVEPDPDRDHSDRVAALQDCIEKVGGDFVAVIRARLDGEDVAQIARRLGIEPATVYGRVNRGKQQLRDCVERKLS